jgi:hypothetical protein
MKEEKPLADASTLPATVIAPLPPDPLTPITTEPEVKVRPRTEPKFSTVVVSGTPEPIQMDCPAVVGAKLMVPPPVDLI